MKKILAMAAGLLVSTSVYAQPVPTPTTIVIDDFSAEQTVMDQSNDGNANSSTINYTIDGKTFSRTLTVDQTASAWGGTSMGAIGDPVPGDGITASVFSMSNTDGVNSTIELLYNIDALLNDFQGASELTLSVLFADAASGLPFTIEGFQNDRAMGSQTFTGAGQLTFTLEELMAAGGNELRLMFTGGAAWDATLDDITILVGTGGGEPVPEPGAIGLLGLGLAAVAFGRRRKVVA